MYLHRFFITCEKQIPEKVTSLGRACFASCRVMLDRMEMGCEMKRGQPEKLACVRSIGVKP